MLLLLGQLKSEVDKFALLIDNCFIFLPIFPEQTCLTAIIHKPGLIHKPFDQ